MMDDNVTDPDTKAMLERMMRLVGITREDSLPVGLLKVFEHFEKRLDEWQMRPSARR